MKIHELITILQQYDQLAEVRATWEGQDKPFNVYPAADGRIIIDADANVYKLRWQETKCKVCGKRARGAPHNGEPVCYDHWEFYKDDGVFFLDE